jgi:diguanylate cyclase (GGDEF)-like protein/PAS domain S-box-containing protein
MGEAARERVLLVDDEPQMLVALEDTLFDEFEVIKTESPEHALRLVEEERDIAVIVSDQRMPKMTGDELFMNLNGQSKATRILITGFADLTAVIRAVNNGNIFAYVTKPWNPSDFRQIVRKGVEHFRLAQELAHRQQLLQDLMENVPDGVYFKDLNLRFTELNRSFSALLDQASPGPLVGKRLSQFLRGDREIAALEQRERAVLDLGTPEVDIVRSWPVNGQARWISESRAPIRDLEGKIAGLVGIARDVSERVSMEQALRTSEDRLQLMFRGSAAGLFDWSAASSEIQYSKSFALLLGLGDSEGVVFPKQISDRVHPDDLTRLKQAVTTHFEARTPLNNVEVRLSVAGGPYRWFLVSGQAVWDEQGRATRLAGSINDITIRKLQEERIERLTRIHAMRGAISSAVVRSTDRDTVTRELCRSAIDVGQFSLAALVKLNDDGQVVSEVWPALHPFVTTMKRRLNVASLPEDSILARMRRSQRSVVVGDGAIADSDPLRGERSDSPWCTVAAFPLVIAGQLDSAFVLFSYTGSFDGEEEKLVQELTTNVAFALSHIKQREQLDLIAYYDGLTALPNRLLLRERLNQCIAASNESADPFALLLIDISRFRNINETLGWRAGDELLAELARLLGPTLSSGDTLARFDGNTFAVLFGAIGDGSDVALYIERYLLPLTKHPFEVQGTELRVALRSGIALFPADGKTPDALIGNAETALRSAKAGGGSYTFYAPHMNARVAEKLTLETKLRRAIEQEELLLHYQPKVDIKTGAMSGLEALVRWRASDGVLVSPAHFIPVLEETGMIVEAGRWILQRAARQHAEWIARGLVVPRIAVNVSARQLAQKDFVAMVDAILLDFPKATSGLDIEITESVFVDNLTDSAEKLRTLRARGFQVAIDDFGTGYSSLGYLSRLPIDALKIDRSFVERMFDDSQDMAIVSTVISLAHALDLKVIAEGVETSQQAHHLRLLRCDQLQGYLAAKPLPPEQVEALFGTTLLDPTRRSG